MLVARLPNSITRILTASLGIPLVVFLTYLGGWPFLVFVIACALLSQHELYVMMAKAGMAPLHTAGLLLGLVIGVRTVLPLPLSAGIVAVVVLFLASHLRHRTDSPLQSVSATVFGIVYPTTMLTFLVDIRVGFEASVGNDAAFWLTMAVFLLVWSSDTAAYYVGKTFGKHKLAPQISPNKTWEGAVGGGVSAILVAIGLGLTVLPFLSPLDCVILGVICGSIGQLGDIAERRIKRMVDVKDSGNILPGHGGVLDRFDAMTIAAPIAYFYLFYVAGAV